MKNREREFQRPQKPRLRARTQFRARPEVPGDDAGGSQSARLRLAHHVGTAGAALAGCARSRRQANQLLRPHPHAARLCRLSLLGGPPRIPHDLHYPARTREKPGRPLNNAPIATFRTAGKEADAAEERIVEEMRLLGREALQGWAEKQVEVTEREIRQQPHMHRRGKKSPLAYEAR